ncbi:recombinase family protein [Schinkia azotoformans]|uniref:recombinase family protein n=1 Tax=Schinkia azotoformans TaxID=1454 RepID=UPI002DB565C6|nr:recombinase family protein [Schinkia azotoformans]MEC1716500.1 recombinase family protein [Schinkia azotoformans]MEC1759103.1 recombinase family protein [Schinkia azotoformans]
MIKGYARVSAVDQNLDRQLKQLNEDGCEIIYQEKVSGATTNRQELQKMLDELEKDDIVIVTDLTRISRSSRDLFDLVDIIKDKGASLKSLKDTWLDTSSENPYSQFLLTVMAGVSQLERDLAKMRQKEGVEIAKIKGKYRGRLKKYTEKHPGMNHAIELYKKGNKTVKEIEEITNVSRSALYRRLKELNIPQVVESRSMNEIIEERRKKRRERIDEVRYKIRRALED